MVVQRVLMWVVWMDLERVHWMVVQMVKMMDCLQVVKLEMMLVEMKVVLLE